MEDRRSTAKWMLDEARDSIGRIEWRGLLKNMHVTWGVNDLGDMLFLNVALPTFDVHTGNSTQVCASACIHVEVMKRAVTFLDGLLQDEIRRAVRGMLLHELDEAMWIDGKPMRDPHPERRAPAV
jgi:hypothetical protein